MSAGNDRRVLSWDVATGELRATLDECDHAVAALQVSHSGRWVATAGFGQALRICDLTGAGKTRELDCKCPDVRAIAISDDDRYLAVGGRNGRIRIWDLTTDQMEREVQAHRQRIRVMIFRAGGDQLISAGEDRLIRIWNWHTDDQVVTLPRQSGKIMAMVACGEKLLATAGSDNTIRLWDVTARREVSHLTGHTGSVAALAYHKGTLVSGGYDTVLRFWAIPNVSADSLRSAKRVR